MNCVLVAHRCGMAGVLWGWINMQPMMHGRAATRGLVGLIAGALLAAGGLTMTAAPASAAWSRPGDLVKYRLCRASVDGGDQWRFVSKVRRHAETPDARAGLRIYSGNDKIAHWRTGWLDESETQILRIRIQKSPKVRLEVWQEAGDLDSNIGTAWELTVIKPRRIRRCGA